MQSGQKGTDGRELGGWGKFKSSPLPYQSSGLGGTELGMTWIRVILHLVVSGIQLTISKRIAGAK